MGTCTKTESIAAAKNNHSCSWCNQKIAAGEPYKKYRWFDGGDASTIKMHPECLDACDELVAIEKEPIEFYPGLHPRGCYCEHDLGCEHCKTN